MYNGLTVDEMVRRYSKALHAEAEAQRAVAHLKVDVERLTNEVKVAELLTADPKEAQWKLDLRVDAKLRNCGPYQWIAGSLLEAEHDQRVAKARVKVYELVLGFVDADQVRHERIVERMRDVYALVVESGVNLVLDECNS